MDVRLGGEPEWVVGVPLEGDIAWVVALRDGRLEAFRLDAETRAVEPWLVAPDVLPPGAPPLVAAEGEELRLVYAPEGLSSPLTHPVSAGDRLLGVAGDARLFVEPGKDMGITALPDARVVRSDSGLLAVLADPTTSYAHGVLGDDLEAASIAVIEPGQNGPEAVRKITPRLGSVFETVAPLWFEAPTGEELLAVTESGPRGGSRISVYRPSGELVAAGPPFGEPMRWRHLLAAGPFGPNGETEIVATRTPHIGGVVEFYRPDLGAGTLELVAELPGYSTHRMYSRNLDTARAGDLDGDGAWELLVPDQSYAALAAIRRTGGGAEEAWRVPVGGTISTNLASATDPEGRLSVAAGRSDGFLRIWP